MSTRGAQQAESGQVWQGGRGLGVTLMVTRQWRRRAVALAASVLLAGEACLSASSAMAAPVAAAADRVVAIPAASAAAENRGVAIPVASRAMATAPGSQPHQQRQLPEAGFDGILVAAIGAGLTGAGWLLMLTGSRRLRRRSR
jgi:microcystin-dependent protein